MLDAAFAHEQKIALGAELGAGQGAFAFRAARVAQRAVAVQPNDLPIEPDQGETARLQGDAAE